MLELWIKLPWSAKEKKEKKKKESGSRFAKWLLKAYLIVIFIFVGLPLLLWLLWYLNTSDDLVKYYAYTLFPQIGAVKLEGEYKATFINAENVMIDSNNLIDKKAFIATSTSDVENVATTLKNNFAKRNDDYVQLIRLDHKALSLNLPQNYKEFYQKRLAADTLDYAAFKTYRLGEEKMLDANVSFVQFENDYSDAYKKSEGFGNTITPRDVLTMKQDVAQADVDYQEVAGIADTTDNFSQGILDLVQHQHDFITILQQVVEGYGTNNSLEISTALYNLSTIASSPAIDSNAVMDEWVNDKLFPAIAKQDAMHATAWEMYSDTYAFAKSQHLYSIVNMWGKYLPTADKQYSPKSTSQYSS